MTILDRGANAFAALAAISKSQAMIEFDLSGKILTANDNFCKALGYELSEIVGKHHSMFVEPAFAASPEYKDFWVKLGAGNFDQQQYKRIGKGGKEVWIEASYNPVIRRGRPVKVIKIATDITAQKLKVAEDSDLAPKFYPVLSSLQRFWVAVFGAVAAGCGAEPYRLRSTASRRGLMVWANSAGVSQPRPECGRWWL